MSSLLRLERKQKNSSNPCRIRIFFFLSYSFGIETIKTFIQSRSSLKNHTRFQTKTADQNGTKTRPDGAAHTSEAYIGKCFPRAICPAAGKSLKETKCKTIQIFFRISAQSPRRDLFPRHTVRTREAKEARRKRKWPSAYFEDWYDLECLAPGKKVGQIIQSALQGNSGCL